MQDNNQNIIRAINLTSNTISTIAGISMQQAATYNDGDGGPATSAKLNAPVSLLFDPSQNKLYIAESVNWAIRVIDLATGIISNYAGDGAYTQNIQADSKLFYDSLIILDTPLSSSIVNGPKGLALDVNNNKMYFAETYFNIIARVVDRATNTVSTLYGSPNSGFTDQSGSVASIRGIGAMEYDSLRNVLYVSDAESIKKVDLTARNVTTLADISLYPPYQMDATANGFAIDYARNVLYFTNAYTYQVSALDLADGSSIYPIAGKELKSGMYLFND
jgi:adhesin/invasin